MKQFSVVLVELKVHLFLLRSQVNRILTNINLTMSYKIFMAILNPRNPDGELDHAEA